MGRGSRSFESEVKKERQEYSQNQAIANGGGLKTVSSVDSCLFSFKASMRILAADASRIEESSSVVIVPHYTNTERLELFIDGKTFGLYRGPNAKKILACIKKWYIYDGVVESLNKTEDGIKIEYLVQGHKR